MKYVRPVNSGDILLKFYNFIILCGNFSCYGSNIKTDNFHKGTVSENILSFSKCQLMFDE